MGLVDTLNKIHNSYPIRTRSLQLGGSKATTAASVTARPMVSKHDATDRTKVCEGVSWGAEGSSDASESVSAA